MCEIAVIDPEQYPIQATQQLAGLFHEEQGDGIGVVAIKTGEAKFEYDTYKSTDPHWQTLYAFLNRNYDNSWRIILHGRNATSGDVNRTTAHPISVDCPKCEFDHVVHNGSLNSHRKKRTRLRNKGHHVHTQVDSELIAHQISTLPDSIEDHRSSTYSMYGNLSYLVLSEDGILIRVEDKYELSEDFTMTCSAERWEDPEGYGFGATNDNEWMLITPGLTPNIETKERTVRTVQTGTGRGSSAWSGGRTTGRLEAYTAGAPRDDPPGRKSGHSGKYRIPYEDHCDVEGIVALKVAPGVMKIIDEEEGTISWIRREYEPKLYYWYAPDPVPENMEQLEQLASSSILADPDAKYTVDIEDEDDDMEQVPLEDFPQREMGEAIQEEVATTIATHVDELTIRDLAEIDDKITEAIDAGTEAALAAHANYA